MKRIKYIILMLITVAGFGLTALPASVGALNAFPACDGTSANSSVCNSSKNENEFTDFIRTITNTLLFVIGAVAVVTIIIAAIRYTTSHGDPKAVQVAKDTLLYAVIGLVVAVSAFAVVNFVAGVLPK